MTIGIDARFWSEQGHGRYLRNLIHELEKTDQTNHYSVFLLKKDYDAISLTNPHFTKVVADIRWYTVDEQRKLPKIYRAAHLDLLHVPHFNVPLLYTKPFIVTIHDLTIKHFATKRSTTLSYPIWLVKRLSYKFVLWSALKRAKKIIAVSDYTKSEIEKYYPFTRDKIIVTHEAVESTFLDTATRVVTEAGRASIRGQTSILADHIKQKYQIGKPYLLYIGNVHPHKNIERLITVFATMHQNSPTSQLVLVGKDDYFQKRLQLETEKLHLGTDLIWTGFVPDEDLIPLIHGAALFVFPSLMEGFGLPPLEAMACGTPVLASNVASLPEVCGDAAMYCNPEDPADIEQKIKEVLANKNLRSAMIQKGYQQVRKFSWEALAKQTLQVYTS